MRVACPMGVAYTWMSPRCTPMEKSTNHKCLSFKNSIYNFHCRHSEAMFGREVLKGRGRLMASLSNVWEFYKNEEKDLGNF